MKNHYFVQALESNNPELAQEPFEGFYWVEAEDPATAIKMACSTVLGSTDGLVLVNETSFRTGYATTPDGTRIDFKIRPVCNLK